MNAVQATTQTTSRTPAQIRDANAHSASRAKTLHWEGYQIEQIDAFTFHILRPLSVVLAETTQSFMKGRNGSEVPAFYVIDAERISEGIVVCGCPGYEGWKKCCCHSELFQQAFEIGKLDADARAFAAESAKMVPVTASHAAPINEAATCDCGKPVWVAAYQTYKRCYQCEHKDLWG